MNHHRLAPILKALGDEEGEIDNLKKALQINPSNILVRNDLGLHYKEKGFVLLPFMRVH